VGHGKLLCHREGVAYSEWDTPDERRRRNRAVPSVPAELDMAISPLVALVSARTCKAVHAGRIIGRNRLGRWRAALHHFPDAILREPQIGDIAAR